MMNDSVREELETKITSGGLRPTPAMIEPRPIEMKFVEESSAAKIELKKEPLVRESAVPIPAVPPVRRVHTTDLAPPKTSPTLVEFQTQKATVPDWRLQIQNAVQQRIGGSPVKTTAETVTAAPAVKPLPVQKNAPIVTAPEGADPRVAAAMQRINESRKAFLPKTPAERMAAMKPVEPREARPFNLVPPKTFSPAKPANTVAPKPLSAPATARSMTNAATAVAASPAIKIDTNKLPKLETVIPENPPVVPTAARQIKLVEKPAQVPIADPASEVEQEHISIRHIRIKAEHLEIEAAGSDQQVVDEIEDLAPFSMRFGAGLFDLIIGGFVSMLALSPIAFSGTNWLTATGALTFAGAWTLVMFLYMTASLGFYGKTLGMRLFSLELVDAVENEYPTIQQAAVNSALFLLTLPLAGVGFITVFFNEENRAVHDLLSGTILVREF